MCWELQTEKEGNQKKKKTCVLDINSRWSGWLPYWNKVPSSSERLMIYRLYNIIVLEEHAYIFTQSRCRSSRKHIIAMILQLNNQANKHY